MPRRSPSLPHDSGIWFPSDSEPSTPASPFVVNGVTLAASRKAALARAVAAMPDMNPGRHRTSVVMVAPPAPSTDDNQSSLLGARENAHHRAEFTDDATQTGELPSKTCVVVDVPGASCAQGAKEEDAGSQAVAEKEEMDEEDDDIEVGSPSQEKKDGPDAVNSTSALGHKLHAPYTTIPRAIFHIVKGNVGMGIFLLPVICQDAGYVMSPIFSILLGIMVIDCTVMLIECRELVHHVKGCHTFSDVGDFIFGPIFRKMVNLFTCVGQIGICILYVQLASGAIAEMVDFTGEFQILVAASILVVLPISFFSNNISLLALFSGTAVCMVVLCIGITVTETGRALAATAVHKDANPFGHFSRWPIFFASQLTVLEGICVVLPVRRAMSPEHQKHTFKPMIVKTLAGIVAVYVVYGLSGYLAFGDEIKTSLVSALPLGTLGYIARAALAINVLFSCPLQFTPAVEIFDTFFGVEHEHTRTSKVAWIIRVVIHLFIGGIALAVGPNAIDLVLSFVGSIASTSLSLTVPAMLRLHVQYAMAHPTESRTSHHYYKSIFQCHDSAPLTWERVRAWIYVFVGISITVVGLVSWAMDVVAFASPSAPVVVGLPNATLWNMTTAVNFTAPTVLGTSWMSV